MFLTLVVLFPSFSLMSKEAEAERASKIGGYFKLFKFPKPGHVGVMRAYISDRRFAGEGALATVGSESQA